MHKSFPEMRIPKAFLTSKNPPEGPFFFFFFLAYLTFPSHPHTSLPGPFRSTQLPAPVPDLQHAESASALPGVDLLSPPFLFPSPFYLCMWCVCTCTPLCLCGGQRTTDLSFHHVGLREQIQARMVGSKHIYLSLSHLFLIPGFPPTTSLCTCVYVQVHLFMCVCICGSQVSVSGIVPQALSTIFF